VTDRKRFRGGVEARRAMQRLAIDRCPWCGRANRFRAHGRGGAKWAEAWGHRCPHGEACPAGGDPGELAVCSRCTMAGEAAGTMFRCEPYATTLTRAACARRHQLANAGAAHLDAASRAALTNSKCVGCPVGQAHRDGEVAAAATPAPVALCSAELLVRRSRRTKRQDALERDQFRATNSTAGAGPARAERPARPGRVEEPGALVRPAPAIRSPRPEREEEETMETKTCVMCKKEFDAPRKDSRICSDHSAQEKQQYYEAERKKGTQKPKSASNGKARPTKPTPAKAPLQEARHLVEVAKASSVLEALGWSVQDLGAGPNGGRLLVISEAAS